MADDVLNDLRTHFIGFLDKREAGELIPALQDAAEAMRDIEVLQLRAVEAARKFGYSWQTIADQMGVSKQTVWSKYHKGYGIA